MKKAGYFILHLITAGAGIGISCAPSAVRMSDRAEETGRLGRYTGPEAGPRGGSMGELYFGEWVDPNKETPAGTRYQTFFSPTIQAESSYLLYLPAAYEKTPDARFPVVYWLHGSGVSPQSGDAFVQNVDQAIQEGRSPPMIVALVNGLAHSFYIDAPDGARPVETVIIKGSDLPYRQDLPNDCKP